MGDQWIDCEACDGEKIMMLVAITLEGKRRYKCLRCKADKTVEGNP